MDTVCAVVENLTGGPQGGKYITDVTNASRTMLMNIHTLQWDDCLCRSVRNHLLTVVVMSHLSVGSNSNHNSHDNAYGAVIVAVHCHCESSPGLSDECSTQCQVAANLWTKPISLSQ